MRDRFPTLAIAIMAATFVMMTASRADASFIAFICGNSTCGGAGNAFVMDGGPGDINLAPGIIEFTVFNRFGFGSLSVTASSKPARTGPGPSMGLDFAAVDNISNLLQGHAFIYALDEDFATTTALSGHLFGTSASTGSIRATTLSEDEPPTFSLSSSTPTTFFGGDFHVFDATLLHPAPPPVDSYAVRIGVEISISLLGPSAASTEGQFQVEPVSTPPPTTVPEPTSLMLLGTGLASAFVRRRFGV